MSFILFSSWALIQLAATLSPGPAFAMSLKNTMAHGWRCGLYTAIGLALGVCVHVMIALAGSSVLLLKMPLLYSALKYAGATYLFWIGFKSLKSAYTDWRSLKTPDTSALTATKSITDSFSRFSALRQGFITNLCNPKALVFFTAVTAQFVSAETTLLDKTILASLSIVIEGLWFSVLAFGLTRPAVQKMYRSITHWVESIFGAALIGLGVKLAL